MSRIRMKVGGIIIDPSTGNPVVLLQADRKQMSLPMWVGVLEATAIAGELAELDNAPPGAHRLAKDVIDALGAKIARVDIDGIYDGNFTAVVRLRIDGQSVAVPARASEAIALALSASAPIYVDSKVLAQTRRAPELDPRSPERLRDLLESLEPEDFGNFRM